MAGISIDLGIKSYDICDAGGNPVGTIRFNPSDPGLASRWAEVEKRVKTLTADIPGTPEAIGALDAEIKKNIDYAFGTPVSAVVFQSVSSLAMCVNGKLVLENVLEALAPLITDALGKAEKASKARIAKYTKAYEGTAIGLAPEQK